MKNNDLNINIKWNEITYDDFENYNFSNEQKDNIIKIVNDCRLTKNEFRDMLLKLYIPTGSKFDSLMKVLSELYKEELKLNYKPKTKINQNWKKDKFWK